MPDIQALYQSIILDHNRRPRNFRAMENADRRVEGRNPSCGDELTLWVRMDGDVIGDVSFQGKGCAISKASASLMTAAVKGKSRDEARVLFERVHAMVTGKLAVLPEGPSDPALGSLAALSGVSRFPFRVKCASLAWHALRSALERETATVTTESPAVDA